ncbi:unnamed protein product [Nesidiocoris tenuis]|uniref:Collagen type IV alpha-3-binding protein n=1 Tax=Nesidiocoris tenuis TaxID=355587 RepID=A0A6H5GLA2_9HEMI|nr:unnamed protein product [Nesidiocoris tenuis]
MDPTPRNSVASIAHGGDAIPLLRGVLQKWTNYVLGWQKRYFEVRQNCLLYFKSEADSNLGCRGAINLSDALVIPHELDECRFDVRILDLIWYMRAETAEERHLWTDCLMKISAPEPMKIILEEKIEEVATLGDKIHHEVHDMLDCVDDFEKLVSGAVNSGSSMNEEIVKQIRKFSATLNDKRSSFEASVAKFQTAVSECADRFQSGRLCSTVKSVESLCFTDALTPGAEESEHCVLSDEDFFDAVESRLEKIEEEAQLRRRLENSTVAETDNSSESFSTQSLEESIRRITEDQIRSAVVRTDDDDWTLLADQDNVKLFSREMVVDGVAIDPLKACCTIRGITGREVCHYFFHPEYRKDWESALERMTVVKKIEENTLVLHQVYKKVWPAAQRDTLFWSHLTSHDSGSPDTPPIWAVVNHSTDHPRFPAGAEFVRVTFSVCLLCTTIIEGDCRDNLSRNNISCQITYSSTLNPGGWVPISAVRALRRIEYPKFLSKFTSYVVEQTKDKEITL